MSSHQIAMQHAAPGAVILSTGEWESWFAWRPVRLFMSRRYVWFRGIHRRCVNKAGFETCEYTDEPEAHPAPDIVLRYFH